MQYNYDTVAWFYDPLSRMVFGRSQVDAQTWLLSAIPAGASIAIIGGGTGWILEEIAKVHLHGLSITYVDASEKMVGLAKKRNAGNNSVSFIAANIKDVETADHFDVVITPFLFDNFTEEDAGQIFPVIDQKLRPGGVWLYCDFQDTPSIKHKSLLRMMYLFFRMLCSIKTNKLPDVAARFAKHIYRVRVQKKFMDGFIESVVYEKVQ